METGRAAWSTRCCQASCSRSLQWHAITCRLPFPQKTPLQHLQASVLRLQQGMEPEMAINCRRCSSKKILLNSSLSFKVIRLLPRDSLGSDCVPGWAAGLLPAKTCWLQPWQGGQGLERLPLLGPRCSAAGRPSQDPSPEWTALLSEPCCWKRAMASSPAPASPMLLNKVCQNLELSRSSFGLGGLS